VLADLDLGGQLANDFLHGQWKFLKAGACAGRRRKRASLPQRRAQNHGVVRTFKKLLAIVGMALFVPVLMFEEWGWEPLARGVARLARLPLWGAMERSIRALPPWAAVAVFALPVMLLLPLKLCGLFLLGSGHAMSALVLLMSAKVVGTAIVARLFQLVHPKLMEIPLFARWYPPWLEWKNAVLVRAHDSAPWRAAVGARDGLRRLWQRLRQGAP
jgi:hypothetical protein